MRGTRTGARARAGDVVAALATVALLAWAFAPGVGWDLLGLRERWGWPPPGGRTAQEVLADVPSTPAVRALAALPAADSEEVPEYERDAFGQQWADVDRNGCDTRNDVLARDLRDPSFKPGTRDCVVVAGMLAEPYTGRDVRFARGRDTSALVQIDHVVSLADAWRSGAWRWQAAERTRFANDPANLLAVDGEANEDKGAAAADGWLPPERSYRCAYVARQIAVKTRWGLAVEDAERLAMARIIARCPDQPLPES